LQSLRWAYDILHSPVSIAVILHVQNLFSSQQQQQHRAPCRSKDKEVVQKQNDAEQN